MSESVSSASGFERDFLKVWRVIWVRKYLIALVAILCGLTAAGYALVVTPIYRAEVVVIPAGGQPPPGASSTPLGALMGAAGVAPDNLGVRQRDAVALLRSRYLVEEFVRRNDLTRTLLSRTSRETSLWLAVNRFRESVLSFEEDRQSGTTAVIVDWTDPAVAARWANGFVSLANDLARSRTLRDSRRNIDYIESQVASTNVIAAQRAGYDTIKSEMKTLMLANGQSEYAFIVVDPAVVPEMRIRPKRAIMVLLGLTSGLFASVSVIFGWCVLGSPRLVDRESEIMYTRSLHEHVLLGDNVHPGERLC